MSDVGTLPTIEVSLISDPDVRRAFRAVVQINQQLSAQIHQQQQEIEAILQMMMDKHIATIPEFKRHMLRLQQGDARSERLHGQLAATATAHPAPATTTLPPRRDPPPDIAEPEIDRPRRYTL
jgi:hypothetical protein